MATTLEELARAVLLMRQLQAEYFRGRDGGVLRDCKRQEAHCDRLVAGVLAPPQPTLFDTDAQEGE